MFPKFSENLQGLLKKHDINQMHIFTTNYDGVLDTLLMLNDKEYLTQDGFRQFPFHPDLLDLNKSTLDKYLCLHMHGSYKFERYFGETYKIKKQTTLNDSPVVVFNNPDSKKQFIKDDSVLRVYFDKFEESLSNNNLLIIIGNSLENDPHIVDSIKRNFNRDNTKLYVCDINSNISNVAKRITQLNAKYEVISKPTDSITSMKDFFVLLESMMA